MKVGFFVGLTNNLGPVLENSDVIFDRVVTNVGGAYGAATGRFTAPINGTYQFHVVVSAQGRQKVISVRSDYLGQVGSSGSGRIIWGQVG